VTQPELLRELLPDLGSHVLASVLQRASYARPEEQEAELLASLLLARLSVGPARPRTDDPAVQSARDRLAHSLERPTPRAP
jgi:hypothetical protein